MSGVENKYGGLRLNAQIEKYLHIEEWSRPDISYMTNSLYSFIFCTNAPVFIDLKCVARYFNSKLHHPIIYPCGADISGTNLLRCTYGNGQFDEQIIHNVMELFVGIYHSYDVDDHRSISFIIFTLLGVTVHCKFGKKPCISTHPTD